jgi:hypothetical protein
MALTAAYIAIASIPASGVPTEAKIFTNIAATTAAFPLAARQTG